MVERKAAPWFIPSGRPPFIPSRVEGLLCALLLLLAAGCTARADPAAITVDVTKGDLIFATSFYGEIEAKESHPIFVPEFRNTWQITVQTVVPDGTRVKKGDTVLAFSKGTFEEDLREKVSELAVAEANMRKITEQNGDERVTRTLAIQRATMGVELARLGVVEGVNLISKLDLEKARIDLARAELQLELEKKALASFERKRTAALEVERLKVEAVSDKQNTIRTQLSLMEVKAPADGVLYAPYTRLNWVMAKVAPGKVVRPGDKILEIPELDRFKAVIYVRQRDATLVRIGDEATVVATMFPDQSFKGKIVSKDDFATTRNERTGSSGPQGTLKEMRVVLDLEETEQPLRPGGTLRADVSTVLAKNVVIAPLAALKEIPGGHSATLKSGKVVTVKVGQTSPTHAEILDGLSAGDALKLE